MKKSKPQAHHHSLRLKGYDYSGEGLYFITICTKNRKPFFGKISNGEMILNEIGKTAELFLKKFSKHFSHAIVSEQVVMPNHVHLILVLNDNRKIAKGMDLKGDGTMNGKNMNQDEGITHAVGTCHGMSLHSTDDDAAVGTRHGVSPPHGVSQTANQFGKPVSGSVSVIINQYKSTVKRWCNKNGHEFFQWHSRFHDHIIRNEDSFQNIVNYIVNNPKQWEDDKFFLK